MLRQYFNCNKRLEIFLTCFCNILCYVDNNDSNAAVRPLFAMLRSDRGACVTMVTWSGSISLTHVQFRLALYVFKFVKNI